MNDAIEPLVRVIAEEVNTLNTWSPQEVKYQQSMLAWLGRRAKLGVETYRLLEAGKRKEAEKLMVEYNAARPRREVGFSGHRKMRISDKIIRRTIETCMIEHCLAEIKVNKKWASAFQVTVLKTLLPNETPTPPAVPRRKTTSKTNGKAAATV